MTTERTTQVDNTIVKDEIPESMNAQVPKVNHTLGFGVLHGQLKQQLINVHESPPFYPYTQVCTSYTSEGISTSSENVAMNHGTMDNMVKVQANATKQTDKEKMVAVFHYKRIIAQRSIPIPRFKNLTPVKTKEHVDKGNCWIVELYGHEICTSEYYGGQADIMFTWNRATRLSSSQLKTDVEALVKGTSQVDLNYATQIAELTATTNFRGFVMPTNTTGILTTASGITELVSMLPRLPIACAMSVGLETIPIQRVQGFPSEINVVSHVCETQIVNTLRNLRHRLEQTGPVQEISHSICQFIDSLIQTVKDAAMNNRKLMPHFHKLVGEMAGALTHHGKRVELYKRYNELRLLNEDCDTNRVTASASEITFGLTLGLAIPGIRYYQYLNYEAAQPWNVPEHYTPYQFAHTHTYSGYYDRVKVQLLFNDKTLLEDWRQEADRLVQEFTIVPSPRKFINLFRTNKRRA